MKLYVATKWEHRRRASTLMRQFEALGHTITYDWTQAQAEDVEQARLDLRGVLDADVFVGLFDTPGIRYRGSLVELGAACAIGIPCYIIGNELATCIFRHLPNVHQGLPADLSFNVP